MTQLLGKLLGLDNVQSIEDVRLSLSAAWAQAAAAPWLLALVCLLVAGLSFAFYLRLQHRGGALRIALAAARAAVLCLLLFLLAEPVLVFRSTSTPRPYLWLLWDGTDSMGIEDDLSETERRELEAAIGQPAATSSAQSPPRSRMQYVQALLEKREGNVLASLNERFRLKGFQFDETVRELPGAETWPTQPGALSKQLTTKGQYTALGSAFEELSRRQATSNLAGVVVFSDFDQNSGPPAEPAARRLGVPVYTVGVGPEVARDLRLRLEAPLWMTKSEASEVTVFVEQEGIDEAAVDVRLFAERIAADEPREGDRIAVGTKRVALQGSLTAAVFPYTPDTTGQYRFVAKVDPLEGEALHQNNRAEREVSIRDDFLRLLFVEYEPTWEWRFVKEVFHRDKLVGMRGFRTFLRSADPKVRRENELFVTTLTPKRSDFFANDVIFLGDMPSAALGARFAEQVREFVGKFGGGLVVIAGPRFGPGQLAGTPLVDMLPVVVDPGLKLKDDRPFGVQLTPQAEMHGFMRLGATAEESAKAWKNLGEVPWYQPVARASDRATVLAVHPTDRCPNNQPQPLIAVRQYGSGVVVYVGMNEMWRLRRRYGEKYYRQFWGQMIHQLASRRALGTQKRFVVATDRPQYKVDEQVSLSVEAYDADYQPLPDERLPEGKLTAEVVMPGRTAEGARRIETFSVTRKREATLETRFAVDTTGEYHVRVKDPVTGQFVETRFTVSDVSPERRSAVRNAALQRDIAAATGGKALSLAEMGDLPSVISLPQKTETTVQVVTLFGAWPSIVVFSLVLLLLFGEWLLRKAVTLP
ncbi:MAG: hypothetical protein HYS13_20990 [Planctomycetia bacterium]|nr:hypothetical protein [Planctomycetia bacterium]